MKKVLRLVALGVVCASSPVWANNGPSGVDGYVSGDIRLSNNYLWRGLTLSNHSFAVSHSLSYTFDVGAYLGYWASNVELVNNSKLFETGIEIDFYAGYKAAFGEDGGYGLDFGIQHYFYDVENSYNHNEIYVHLILSDFTVSYYRSEDRPPTNYYEISWSSELGGDGLTTLSLSLGYTQFKSREEPIRDLSAFNYLVGISFYFGSVGDLTLAYSGVFRDADEYGLASVARHAGAARNRFLVSWGISF